MASDPARRRAWPALLLLTLALPALAGGAQAADARLGLTFEPFPPVAPGSSMQVAGNLTYSYDARAANATSVTLLLDAPGGWLHASITPDALSLAANSSRSRTVVPVTLSVTVDHDAPALDQRTVVVHMLATGNPPLDATQGTVSVVVKAGFLGPLDLEASEGGPQRPGDPFNVELNVTSRANGPARVTLDAQPASAKLRVVAPAPFILQMGETRAVNVSALADSAESSSITITYGTVYAFEPSILGEQGVLVVPVHVTQSQLLPGFEAGLVAAALGAALLLTSIARRCR